MAGPLAPAPHPIELAERDEPERFDHNYIGTEHLLLAMLTEGEGVAGTVLRDLGVDHAAASRQLETIVGRGDAAVKAQRDYAPRVRKVLALALKAADEPALTTGHVGTGHLLLGLVREGQGIGAAILKRLGVDPDRVANAVTASLTNADRPLSDT